jgi:hypothetical protein
MGRRDADKPVSPFGRQAVTTLLGRYVREACIFLDYGRGVEG